MRISTLGPLTVDGKPVGGKRLAAVIQELVAARGRPVSVAALVDSVWREDPPGDALAAVQALIARVRRLGVPVETVPGGYRTPTDAIQTDAGLARELIDQAHTLLRAGDRAAARRDADEARALFADAPDLTETHAARLFSDIASVRAECALAGTGPANEEDLRRLVAHRPPDEPAAALLVRVLAQQGRDAEAQDVLERLRTELVDEYGTDPSSVVTEVHLALLRGDLPSARPRRAPRPVLPISWQRPGSVMVGREPDLTAVLDGLTQVPLVTIVAVGGAGKTRLAAEVSRRTSVAVWVVELAGLRTAQDVTTALLSVLTSGEELLGGLRSLGPREQLRTAAAGLSGLVVLDNCEHLLAAAADAAADLINASPDLAVLATSRAPLGLAEEMVHRLPALSDGEALALLEARARLGGVPAVWDSQQALHLCNRLDNLPLALELAAARLRTMPIEDVLAGLSDRFALLDDALRGLPERHARLWAMVGWSDELLEPGRRDLLHRLAVIPAPFTAATAAAVAGQEDVRAGLAALVEQSLLVLETGGRPARYRMLETVREYGQARLGDRRPALTGLLAWAREQAIGLADELIGPHQLATLRALAGDQENLMAALHWALDSGDEAATVDLAAALFFPMMIRGSSLEISIMTAAVLHLDDPVARRRSALLRGEGVDADRLARICLLIGSYAAITGRLRLSALAGRTLRAVLRKGAPEVSPRYTALAGMLPVLHDLHSPSASAGLAALIADGDPYVRGLGLFIRAAADEMLNGAVRSEDAIEAYRCFEAAGDHWGMGMAAQAVAGASAAPDAGAPIDWLTRGVQHMEQIGAAQEAHSAQVLLDARLALAGDVDAEQRLRQFARSGGEEDWDSAQAAMALANLAWQRHEWPAIVQYADTIMQATRVVPDPQPHQRVLFRAAAAVLHLAVAAQRSGQSALRLENTAADLLARSGDEIVSEAPLLGAWATGGALLARQRGQIGEAAELWTLAEPARGSLAALFTRDEFELLAQRIPRTESPSHPDRAARIRDLMARVL